MLLQEVKVLRGPNYWSIKRHKLIQMTLDLQEMESRPTDTIPGFLERIRTLLPTLYHHTCSRGVPGGFFDRVKEGTWMGHVIEHIALEIQALAGIEAGFGRTRGTGVPGVYHVAFCYEGEESGKYAGKAAVRIAEALIAGEEYDVTADIDEIKRLYCKEKIGPSTGSIINEARKRDIPSLCVEECGYIQLGYGKKQKRVQATLTGQTSCIAVDIAGNKDETKRLLAQGFVPVPAGGVVESVEGLKALVDDLGFPLVVKPLDGNHGKGATINVEAFEEVLSAFHRAKEFSQKVVVEQYIQGYDFRILVVNNKMVAAALRTPAHVVGDGVRTVKQLVDATNDDPKRGGEHENVLTAIRIDDVCLEHLAKQGYTLEGVPQAGEKVYLKPTANLSTGGTAEDVTEEVHPKNVSLFERIARIVGLDICGIDVLAPTLRTPLNESGGAVIEVNAAPGFRMHLDPTVGQPRNVAKPVIDMLFPNGDNGRIPVVAITGTNGKTTTTRLVARMAQEAGFCTGYTTTDGIYLNDDLIYKGDCSGPGSAQAVLKDSSVDFAVLETARGGILRAGLGFDKCQTAVVTNVAEDHLGLDGIDTIEKLARVKSVVAEAVIESGYAILNADDDLVYAMKDEVSCQVALFSLYSHNFRIERHCAAGGLAAVYDNGFVLLRKGNQIMPIEEVVNIPITFSGKAEFNIANVLGACLAAYTNDIPLPKIRTVLRSFIPSGETTPGRVNLFEFSNFRVVVDYAHNAHGVRALGKFIKTFDAPLKVGVITGVGDRRDEDIIALGEEAAHVFDDIIIRHDEDLRGRTPEEIDNLLWTGIERVDISKPITYFPDECQALEHAVANACPGSVIVVLIENIGRVLDCIKRLQETDEERATNIKTAV